MEIKNISSLLKNEKFTYTTSRTNKLQESAVDKIIKQFTLDVNAQSMEPQDDNTQNTDGSTPEKGTTQSGKPPKITDEQATVIIAAHLQQGGTARSCDGNTSVTIFGRTVKLATLRKSLKLAGHKGSERKLARAMASTIFYVCSELNLEGNLSSKLTRLNPERTFSDTEKIWLSDFQCDNPECPPALRQLINKSFGSSQKPNRNAGKNKKTGK